MKDKITFLCVAIRCLSVTHVFLGFCGFMLLGYVVQVDFIWLIFLFLFSEKLLELIQKALSDIAESKLSSTWAVHTGQ